MKVATDIYWMGARDAVKNLTKYTLAPSIQMIWPKISVVLRLRNLNYDSFLI